MKPVKVLIATDFSKKAGFALARGVQFAQQNKAKISILHVLRDDWVNRFAQWLLTNKQRKVSQLKREAQRLFDQKIKPSLKKIKFNFAVKIGREDEIIIQCAKKEKSNLLVIGAHGNYHFHEYFLGTTAAAVVKNSPCPVLIVKKRPTFSYEKILIPIDFSPASIETIKFARTYFPNAHITVFHVDDIWYDKTTLRSSVYVKSKIKEKIERFLRKCKVDKNDVKIRILGGYPAKAIAREAQRGGFNLVVIGVRGKSKLHNVVMGSVAERILREVSTDIIAVPPR